MENFSPEATRFAALKYVVTEDLRSLLGISGPLCLFGDEDCLLGEFERLQFPQLLTFNCCDGGGGILSVLIELLVFCDTGTTVGG